MEKQTSGDVTVDRSIDHEADQPHKDHSEAEAQPLTQLAGPSNPDYGTPDLPGLPVNVLKQILGECTPEAMVYLSRSCRKMHLLVKSSKSELCRNVSLYKLVIFQMFMEVDDKSPQRSVSVLGPWMAEIETMSGKLFQLSQLHFISRVNDSYRTPGFAAYMQAGLLIYERFATIPAVRERMWAMAVPMRFHHVLRFTSVHLADMLTIRSCLGLDPPTYRHAARLWSNRHPASTHHTWVRDKFWRDLNSWLFDYGPRPLHAFLDRGNRPLDEELWQLRDQILAEDGGLLKLPEFGMSNVLLDQAHCPEGQMNNLASDGYCGFWGGAYGDFLFWRHFDPCVIRGHYFVEQAIAQILKDLMFWYDIRDDCAKRLRFWKLATHF